MDGRLIHALLVVGFAGAYFGAGVALIPITLNYHKVLADCTRYASPSACGEFPQCSWGTGVVNASRGSYHTAPAPRCVFRDVIDIPGADCRNQSSTRTGCNGPCAWNADANECQHAPAWSPLKVGVFAGSNIAGGSVSTMVASQIMRFVFRGSLRWTGVAVGVLGLLGALLSVLAFQFDTGRDDFTNFPLLVAGRVIVGFAAGLGAIVGPLVGSVLAPPQHRTTASIVFGPIMAVANFATALLSLALNPEHLPAKASRGLYAAQTLVLFITAVGMIIACAFVSQQDDDRARQSEGDAPQAEPSEVQPLAGTVNVDAAEGELEPAAQDSATTLPALAPQTFAGRAGVGILLGIALQVTGITVVMAFAPRLAQSSGLHPLLGNCLLMGWNALTCAGAVPLSRRFSCRSLFIASALAASAACVLTGVPTLVSDSVEHGSAAMKAMNALIIVGVLAVIAGYEAGMGCGFYVLSQSVFLPAERRLGSSITVASCFVSTLVITVAYAPLQSVLSGDGLHGSHSDEKRGQGIQYIAFGAIGFVVTAVLHRYLHPLALHAAQ